MKAYDYRIVNVFAQTHFGGNPLAVFVKADGLDDKTMQNIASQFNLSETAFIFASSDKKAVANVRIFTPAYELPLAGHPILGSAFVLNKLKHLPSCFSLNTVKKSVSITTDDSGQKIEMSVAGFDYRVSKATADELAAAVGLSVNDIDNQALWMDSGSSQLLLKVKDKKCLFNAKIDKPLLTTICQKDNDQELICLWAMQNDDIFIRFFFVQDGAVLQDSGTGSVCANLGAYFILHNQYPTAKCIFQGDDMGRPNRLHLKVDDDKTIFVGGRVIEVGSGQFYVPIAY